MATVLDGSNATGQAANGLSKEKLADSKDLFLKAYEQLLAELLEDSKVYTFTEEARAWTKKMTDYTVPGGKLNRGLSVIDSLRLLKEGGLTEEEEFRACALGWCIEWLQGYFLVEDDIMDKSVTRRGQPCWYRVPQVGLIAINDGILLDSHIYRILKRHFRALPIYIDLVDLFHDVTYQTACGQQLDLITTPEGTVDLSKYTMSTYLKIVQYKTAYYSFYLPVACALYLAGEASPENLQIAEEILIAMGTYFQVQDDYLDCYGAPEVIGKIGTDIEDTKCSWLVVQALQRANEDQKRIIEEQYGRADPACVAEIKKLYAELKLEAAFQEYEQQSYDELTAAIRNVDSERLQAVFLTFLGKVYKRQK
eukprot:TRINITY_DN1198_c0_g1_i2.p1 TRINITY_DN1198_c0_g1~~TRINITY_DN1198_c0_g1_i2.p1  ORF type:complete len:366 (-),score=98.98 TRINITY_DN1198_c0_g1_i2:213-1310(-)